MRKTYNRTIFLTSLLLLIVVLILHFLAPTKFTPTLLPVALILFSATSFFSYDIFQKILHRSPQQFINYYIAFSFLKMLVHLLIMVAMALIIRSEAIALILWYCVLFANFVTIETVFAFKMARKG
jgi:hypothetical protein